MTIAAPKQQRAETAISGAAGSLLPISLKRANPAAAQADANSESLNENCHLPSMPRFYGLRPSSDFIS